MFLNWGSDMQFPTYSLELLLFIFCFLHTRDYLNIQVCRCSGPNERKYRYTFVYLRSEYGKVFEIMFYNADIGCSLLTIDWYLGQLQSACLHCTVHMWYCVYSGCNMDENEIGANVLFFRWRFFVKCSFSKFLRFHFSGHLIHFSIC